MYVVLGSGWLWMSILICVVTKQCLVDKLFCLCRWSHIGSAVCLFWSATPPAPPISTALDTYHSYTHFSSVKLINLSAITHNCCSTRIKTGLPLDINERRYDLSDTNEQHIVLSMCLENCVCFSAARCLVLPNHLHFLKVIMYMLPKTSDLCERMFLQEI